MHRKPLLALLENYKTSDKNEKKMHTSTIDFVKNHENCFERSLLIGHITASAWIVDKNRGNVLMIHHRKLNQWFQPGGHCDGNPDVLATALQETYEETGLKNICVVSKEIFDIDIHLIPERKEVPAHYHYDIRFLLEADLQEPLLISTESNDLAWIPVTDIEDYNNSESILRMVRKVKRS